MENEKTLTGVSVNESIALILREILRNLIPRVREKKLVLLTTCKRFGYAYSFEHLPETICGTVAF